MHSGVEKGLGHRYTYSSLPVGNPLKNIFIKYNLLLNITILNEVATYVLLLTPTPSCIS